MFLERQHGKRRIDSRDYTEQVLEVRIYSLLFEYMQPNTIFMEYGEPIHKGAAKAVCKRLGIKGFNNGWPPSSPYINPIEKIWLWMKAWISEMEPFPTSLKDLKQVVQDLWDELDPCWILNV